MKPRLDVRFSVQSLWVYWFGKINRREGEYYLNHNRTGLLMALQALNLPKGSRVGMMVYDCETVIAAIHQAGYEIVFIDVTDDFQLDLDDLSRKCKGLSALVVTHLFGIPNSMEKIRAICGEIPLIEDCAHAWDSHFADGTRCGLKGDMASWSVGQGKIPTIGDGGILKVNNSKYKSAVEKKYASLNGYSFLGETKLMLTLLFRGIIYKPFFYSLITWKLKQNTARSVTQYIDARKMSKGVLRIFCNECEKVAELVDKHKNFQQQWIEALEKDQRIKLPNRVLLNMSNGFMLPTLSEDREAIIDEYRKKGIELGRHFSQSIAWAKEFAYRDGDCPNAEKIRKQIVVFPTYYKTML